MLIRFSPLREDDSLVLHSLWGSLKWYLMLAFLVQTPLFEPNIGQELNIVQIYTSFIQKSVSFDILTISSIQAFIGI